MILRKIGLSLNEVFGGYGGLTKPLKTFDLMPINSRLSLPMRLTVSWRYFVQLGTGNHLYTDNLSEFSSKIPLSQELLPFIAVLIALILKVRMCIKVCVLLILSATTHRVILKFHFACMHQCASLAELLVHLSRVSRQIRCVILK